MKHKHQNYDGIVSCLARLNEKGITLNKETLQEIIKENKFNLWVLPFIPMIEICGEDIVECKKKKCKKKNICTKYHNQSQFEFGSLLEQIMVDSILQNEIMVCIILF